MFKFKQNIQTQLKAFSKKQILFECKKPSPLSLEERKKIHLFLIEKIKAQKIYQKYKWNLNSLLRLGVRPQHPFIAVSISHCPSLAGFVFVFQNNLKKKISLGLDIEESHRISQKVISRVSQTQEQNSSPRPDFLWTAKESSFKCFSESSNPLLIKDCRIYAWKAEKKSYTFKAQYKKNKARGLVFSIKHLSIAYTEANQS
ncbi:MAG: hypothetical protein GDA46_03995 [Bdellovibrionales bacterium]|nr:hypothetical protein [Bdellovibrionales bacterium]